MAGAKEQHSIAKSKWGMVTKMDCRAKVNSNQNSLTCGDLWRWLADHGIPRKETDDGWPTGFRRILGLVNVRIT